MAPFCTSNDTDCRLPWRTEAIVLVEAVSSVLLTLLCFLGNAIVCVCVYRDKHLRSVPNLFIVNLSVTNILLCSTVWPFWTVTLATGQWPLEKKACYFQGFQNHCLMTSLALTITVLGLNRYVMLVYPFIYRKLFKRVNAYRLLVIQWFIAITWAALRFAPSDGYEFIPEFAICENSKEHKLISLLDLIILILFTILTIFCYYKVFVIIRKHVSSVVPDRGRDTEWPPATGSKAYYYEEVNFTRTSVLIFFAYGICWLPLIVLGILMLVGVSLSRSLTLIAWYLIALSCALHPVINIASNKLFRKGFYRVLCTCGFDYNEAEEIDMEQAQPRASQNR